MPRISFIPEPYEEGYEKLATFNDAFFDAINEGLSYTSLASSLSTLAKKVSDFKKLNYTDVRDIFISIGSLINFLGEDNTIESLSEDIAELIIQNEEIDNKQPKEIIVKRVNSLLSNKQIYYASKARVLATENENVFIRSRLVTDIRPVFDSNLDENVIAGMIIHHLHIHYQSKEEGPHNDIYISLDSSDIKMLKEDLIRAEKKEQSLKSVFGKSGMTNLDE